MDAEPEGGRTALLRGTQKPGRGQHGLAGTSPLPVAPCVLQVAGCTLRAAHWGRPHCTSQLAHCTWHLARCTVVAAHRGCPRCVSHPAHRTLRLAWWGSPAGMFPLPVAPCAVGAVPPGRRDALGDTGWEHRGWHRPLCQARGQHQAKVKADVPLSREELPPAQASLNPARSGKRNLGHRQRPHRRGLAAGDAGIWPQHGTEVSRAAPAPGTPRGGKLPGTCGLCFK